MTALALNYNWTDHATSFKLDVVSLSLALALHLPLYFMKFDARKKVIDHPESRIVSIDLIDPSVPVPAPPPPPVIKESSLMQKLRMMVHREPPPPPPPPKVEKPPEQLNVAPQQIKIQPNLKLPELAQPKLESKTGFKTAADAKLIEQKQLTLKAPGAGAAPLSEKKLGVVTDRGSLKNAGNFKISNTDSMKAIGGNDATLAGGSAPTIAINSGTRASTEKFSAPAVSKADKGRLGAVGVADVGGPQLGFRDSIIARDAKPAQIALNSSPGGVAGGVPGGVPGGMVGSKTDSGHFQSAGGQTGKVKGDMGPGTIGDVAPRAIAPAKPVQKKSMFTITGPLKDRKILKQVVPEYPAWAQAQGVESSVILEFSVLPDGSVKEDVVVRRTTGYPLLDQTAIKALRQWKFAPVDEDRVEIGQITFNFSLS